LEESSRVEGSRCRKLLLHAVKKFGRKFPEHTEPAGSTFLAEESGALHYEDAKALYRRLSRFFAKYNIKNIHTKPV
jgi:hypothetical protein